MTRSTALMGKGGTGKTLIAVHLAMAMSYLGVRTLLVGCDQKQDTACALLKDRKPSLMERLETHRFDYLKAEPTQVLQPVTPYLDVLELGPSPLLVGNYGGVFDEGFHYFQAHRLTESYQQVIFDVGDERWDSAVQPLLRQVNAVVAVTDESPQSLFVVNRLMRTLLIGAYEYHYPAKLLGLVNNRSRNPLAFERYVEKTRAFPLLTLPDNTELEHLRPFHTTLFAMKRPPPHLDRLITDFIKLAEMLQGTPLNLYTMLPLTDEDIWHLPPPVTMPN